MDSSRIFVRGLPPNITEEEFRRHFSKQYAVTDIRIMPHRRIGYVGYKSHEDAASAVKYFNRSFIRMSRLGVELARPIEQNRLREAEVGDGHGMRAQSLETSANDKRLPLAPTDNKLKRKRDDTGRPLVDSKLQEYLKVMEAPSKSKTWANEDSLRTGTTSVVQPEVPTLAKEDEPSDIEYEERSKQPKKRGAHPETRALQIPTPAHKNDEHPSENPTQSEVRSAAANEQVPPDAAGEGEIESEAATDADWLRTRTSRLLGLTDVDDDSNPTGAESASRPSPHAQDGPGQSKESAAPDANSEESLSSIEADAPLGTVDANVIAIELSGRLFVRNLPYSTGEDELRHLFSPIGQLEEVHVPVESRSGNGKGYAYVQYITNTSAVEAYKTLDGSVFQGRLLHILPATAKKESKLDEFAISKLPLKKQKQIKKKAEAASATFNWNSLYMNSNSIMSSISDRLGVAKSDLLDPTSSDAAVKQAHAETHLIQETKAYFTANGVDLEAFKRRERGDSVILVKNFVYGTKAEELKRLFEEHGNVSSILMPPSGTIAIVRFEQPQQAKTAFASLAYRKFKDSVLFLEKAPKDLFTSDVSSKGTVSVQEKAQGGQLLKPSASDLLHETSIPDGIDTTTLFVRNLNFSTTTEDLNEVFKPLGGFLSARVKTKPDPKKPGAVLSMGFGFLEFRTKAQAQAALDAMNGYKLAGHDLLIRASHKALDAAEERRREDRAKKAAGRRTKIVIKNLPFEATKKDVRSLFGSYGQLRSVRVPKKFDSSTRGFAFADFVTAREAENAMNALKDTHLLGRKLVLDFAAEDAADPEEEIRKMQKKVGQQTDRVALQKLAGPGRRKFNIAGSEENDES